MNIIEYAHMNVDMLKNGKCCSNKMIHISSMYT